MATRRYVHGPTLRRPTTLLREIFDAGVVSGLIGGVAMILFATIYAAAAGLGFWTPVKAIAATVLRISPLELGFGGVIVGLAFHAIVSIFFGVLFALATPREVATVPALAFGALGGVAALVIMSLIVVPLENPTVRAHLLWGSRPGALPVGVAFAMHLIYGAGLSLAPWLRRRFVAGSSGLGDEGA
jgi:hypothetical protein